jgi:hypothetical protein
MMQLHRNSEKTCKGSTKHLLSSRDPDRQQIPEVNHRVFRPNEAKAERWLIFYAVGTRGRESLEYAFVGMALWLLSGQQAGRVHERHG